MSVELITADFKGLPATRSRPVASQFWRPDERLGPTPIRNLAPHPRTARGKLGLTDRPVRLLGS